MKKLFLVMVAVSGFGIAKSQVYFQGGVNLANISINSAGGTEDNNMLTTFNGGIMSRFDISKTVDLETGLLVSGKGSKAETYYTSSRTDNYVKSRFNPIYLEVPLNLVINLPLGKNKLFLTGGPYTSIGIAGKSKSESKFLGVMSSKESDIKFSNDDPFTSQQDDAAYNKLKRFDFGLNIGGGLDLGKVLLKANYGYGLTKINSTESNNSADDKNKYRTISISLGIPVGR